MGFNSAFKWLNSLGLDSVRKQQSKERENVNNSAVEDEMKL